MNKGFYTKLAVSNLKKNAKTYLPYILSSIFCVAMFYIMSMLSTTKFLEHDSLKQMLTLGVYTIGIFSVIFLFYTNSFLIKRRKMEFGLFNVLGMNKRHIAKVISLETLFTSIISLGLGLVAGMLLSKLMYLILGRIINFKLQDVIMIEPHAIVSTLILFLIVFALTLLNSMRMIHLSKPIELLRGGQTGEKEPKTKWILTVLGLISLGIGYYLAVTIDNPIDAMLYFFVAVIFVIIGTYCLFASISIFVLKMLKRNKNYYYKTNHFISVSSMMYRMKQNAVGLANICILSTVVLVTISTTVSLYVGVDDILNERFPKDISVTASYSEENKTKIDEAIDTVLDKSGYEASNRDELVFYSGVAAGENGQFIHQPHFDDGEKQNQYIIVAITADNYNKLTGEDADINKDEAIVYMNKNIYKGEKLSVGSRTFKVMDSRSVLDKTKDSEIIARYADSTSIDAMVLIVSDDEVQQQIAAEGIAALNPTISTNNYGIAMNGMQMIIDFDVDASNQEQIKLESVLNKAIEKVDKTDVGGDNLYVESRSAKINSFYNTYGGLFFLGIYLGIIFLMATVIIIYYKQISEGYEDKERFKIMQNVGLTKREVRKAIRSQVLTMFFMPLIISCVHIAFAFPMISKMLQLFNLTNMRLFMICTIICAAVFALFYIGVYVMTSRQYYRIVESD